jgi:DNA-binding IclR family transcriptional regulator
MVKGSDEILETLDDLDTAAPIGVLDIETGHPKSTLHRAVDKLAENGFIEKHPDYSSYYRITEKGRGYLAGDVDARDDE